MKKFFATLVAALLACACMMTILSGCDSAPEGSDAEGDAAESADDPAPAEQSVLQMEKRYIFTQDVKAKMPSFYLFHEDGTGEYTYHHDSFSIDENHPSDDDWHYHYTIYFKYTYVDIDHSAVVCFYDRVVYQAEDNTKIVKSSWMYLLTVSENVIVETGTSSIYYYVNEDYLETIPNFTGK